MLEQMAISFEAITETKADMIFEVAFVPLWRFSLR